MNAKKMADTSIYVSNLVAAKHTDPVDALTVITLSFAQALERLGLDIEPTYRTGTAAMLVAFAICGDLRGLRERKRRKRR